MCYSLTNRIQVSEVNNSDKCSCKDCPTFFQSTESPTSTVTSTLPLGFQLATKTGQFFYRLDWLLTSEYQMPKLHYFQASLPYQSLLEKLQVVESSVAIETAP